MERQGPPDASQPGNGKSFVQWMESAVDTVRKAASKELSDICYDLEHMGIDPGTGETLRHSPSREQPPEEQKAGCNIVKWMETAVDSVLNFDSEAAEGPGRARPSAYVAEETEPAAPSTLEPPFPVQGSKPPAKLLPSSFPAPTSAAPAPLSALNTLAPPHPPPPSSPPAGPPSLMEATMFQPPAHKTPKHTDPAPTPPTPPTALASSSDVTGDEYEEELDDIEKSQVATDDVISLATTNDSPVAEFIREEPPAGYKQVWARGSKYMTIAAKASGHCKPKARVPLILQPAVNEITRQLTPLPQVLDYEEESSMVVGEHPLGNIITSILNKIHEASDEELVCSMASEAVGHITSEAVRDVSQLVILLCSKTPLEQLKSVRGLSHVAIDGIVPTAKAASELRSIHRQAVMYMGKECLQIVRSLERRAIMNADNSRQLLETREVVGSGIRALSASVFASLEAVETCYSYAIPPLRSRLAQAN